MGKIKKPEPQWRTDQASDKQGKLCMSILANTTLIMRMGITALADIGFCRIALWLGG